MNWSGDGVADDLETVPFARARLESEVSPATAALMGADGFTVRACLEIIAADIESYRALEKHIDFVKQLGDAIRTRGCLADVGGRVAPLMDQLRRTHGSFDSCTPGPPVQHFTTPAIVKQPDLEATSLS